MDAIYTCWNFELIKYDAKNVANQISRQILN